MSWLAKLGLLLPALGGIFCLVCAVGIVRDAIEEARLGLMDGGRLIEVLFFIPLTVGSGVALLWGTAEILMGA